MVNRYLKKGQVTLLAVILAVLGLTLGLSVASRSLSDLRQASTVDFGLKALAAAESGVEFGLSRLTLNGSLAINCGTSYDLVANNDITFPPELGISSLTYEICESGDTFAKSNGAVNKDDVFQVNFPGYTGNVSVYLIGDVEGVQINSLSLNGGVYSVSRFAYKNGASLPGSNFSPALAWSPSCDPTFDALSGSAKFRADSVSLTNAVLLRVTPLGGLTGAKANVLVCPNAPSPVIPPQYYDVTATATTANGTIKKVTVKRNIAGTLPGIFDSVLFSGGDINKY